MHLQDNVPSVFYLELLSRIAVVLTVQFVILINPLRLQDYIGNLSEGGIRKNATLVYELMHEIMVFLHLQFNLQDGGYVESTSSEFLQDYIYTRSENNSLQFMVCYFSQIYPFSISVIGLNLFETL